MFDTSKLDDAFIDGVVTVANDKNVLQLLEPNVRCHGAIDKYQVRRVLYAAIEIVEAYERLKAKDA